jgi:hypothetical protein
MISADCTEGVHHICAAVQAKDLFLGIPNGEFASSLNVIGAGKVERSDACFGEIGLKDIPSFAK